MVSLLKALTYTADDVAAAGLALLVAFQEHMAYMPAIPGIPRAYAATPARFGMEYEDAWLRSTDGVKLHSCCPIYGPERWMMLERRKLKQERDRHRRKGYETSDDDDDEDRLREGLICPTFQFSSNTNSKRVAR